MFYKIGNKYYILIGSKYTQVDFRINKDNVYGVPSDKSIEKTSQIKAIPKSFDEVKKELLESQRFFDEKPIGEKRDRRTRFER